MTSVLELDLRARAAQRVPTAMSRNGFSIVGKLRGSGRADVSICLPEGAARVEDLVVVRALAQAEGPALGNPLAQGPGGESQAILDGVAVEGHGAMARRAPGAVVFLPAELELAASIYHDNIVRTVGTGWENGRPFIVSEYLEGTTLRRLLRWLGSRGQRLANAELARLLVGIIAAVEHADRSVKKPEARALVHQIISADDVFVTYSGDVKLLGFKPARPRSEEDIGLQPGEDAALDALLSTHQSPELAAVLAAIGARVSATSVLGLWQSVQTLVAWQTELGTDGRVELAAVMSGVMPEGRASRRAQLDAACSRVLRSRQAASERGSSASDEAPASGYRTREAASRASTPPPLPWVEVSSLVPPPPSFAAVTPPPLPLSAGRLANVRGSNGPLLHAPAVDAFALDAVGAGGDASPSAAPGGPLEAVSLETVPAPEPSPFAHFAFSQARRTGLPWALLAGLPLLGLVAAFVVRGDVHMPSRAVETTTASLRAAPPGAERQGALSSSVPPEATRSMPSADAHRGRWKEGDKPRGAPARTAAPVRQAPGYLTLDTTIPVSVTIGTRALGETPLHQVELTAGSHVLELRNAKVGIAASVVVNISSGQTAQRHIELAAPR